MAVNNQHSTQGLYGLLSPCPPPVVDALIEAGNIYSYKKNKLIYKGLNPHVHILLSGSVKICKTGKNNQTMIKDVIYPGSFFGECSLFSGYSKDDKAISIDSDSQVLTILQQRFKTLGNKHPEVISLLLQELGRKIIQKEEKLASFHFNDAKSRILHFIQTTAKKTGVKVGFETLIKHSFTQQDIANITGTSRQTVTFVFNELKKENIIHFDRKRILIRDMDRL